MTAGPVMPAFKKIGELLSDYMPDDHTASLVALGPASPFFGMAQLIHAAVNGTVPDLSGLRSPAYAEDGIDLCYVKDCGPGPSVVARHQPPAPGHRVRARIRHRAVGR
jgi:UDP-glucose 4-epimerase